MYKMLNKVQNYTWGSPDILPTMYGLPNPDHLPIAELWMGAHPVSSSLIIDKQGQEHSLRQWIAADPVTNLGPKVAGRFGQLPFLFKVLCAAQPLSIQVHPGKKAAEAGFAREQQAGLALNDPSRNYKDDNHKPELIYALTPFHAMNGFRPVAESSRLLQPFSHLAPEITNFVASPQAKDLAALFTCLLELQGEKKEQALALLKSLADTETTEPWSTVKRIACFYPQDCGLFAPLLLNVVTLQPGEAMFLREGTPHAYLHGVGLEVMANSDNVLRAGLTPKHIDIPELLSNLHTVTHSVAALYSKPQQQEGVSYFPVPVADFAFSVHQVTQQASQLTQESAAILFCIEGCQQILRGEECLELQPGESCYIPACESPVLVTGHGRMARVYNEL
ncbi:MAG: mannose-6-phosphate isomerase [Enterobacteriaceae bacterium]